MDDDKYQRVQDYTDAFLWMCYLLLVMTLVMIWGVWGYVAALALCAGIHYAIGRFASYRARTEAEWEARVQAAVARARR